MYVVPHYFSQHTAIKSDNSETAKTKLTVSKNGEAMAIFRRNTESPVLPCEQRHLWSKMKKYKSSPLKKADNPENYSGTSTLVGGNAIHV